MRACAAGIVNTCLAVTCESGARDRSLVLNSAVLSAIVNDGRLLCYPSLQDTVKERFTSARMLQLQVYKCRCAASVYIYCACVCARAQNNTISDLFKIEKFLN